MHFYGLSFHLKPVNNKAKNNTDIDMTCMHVPLEIKNVEQLNYEGSST